MSFSPASKVMAGLAAAMGGQQTDGTMREIQTVVSNQKMNTFLHELCKLAGFNEQIRITYYRGNERFEARISSQYPKVKN